MRGKSKIMKVFGRINGAPLIYEFSLAAIKFLIQRDLIAKDSKMPLIGVKKIK